MSDLILRKKLIKQKINSTKREISQNNEFIRLFHNENIFLSEKINNYLIELKQLQRKKQPTKT